MRLIAFPLALLVLLDASIASAEPPVPAPAPAPVEARTLPPCGEPTQAAEAVKLAFSDLVIIHRSRVPGPSGQPILDRKLDALVEKTLDFERFATVALSPMWDEQPEETRLQWVEELRIGLRGHYIRRLTADGSPLGQTLEVLSSHATCDRATVEVALGPRARPARTQVTLKMLWTGLGWQAYDVVIDGVSLLETWKNRFRALYRDGGVVAVDGHLREFAERHRAP